jgi:hypothetical protein
MVMRCFSIYTFKRIQFSIPHNELRKLKNVHVDFEKYVSFLAVIRSLLNNRELKSYELFNSFVVSFPLSHLLFVYPNSDSF